MLIHLKRAVTLDADWKNFAKDDSDFSAFLTDPDWGEIVYS